MSGEGDVPTVDYGCIRRRLRTGDAIWTTDDFWRSRVVRWGTGGIVSHMAMVVRTEPVVLILEPVDAGNAIRIGVTRLSSRIAQVQARPGGRVFVGTQQSY